MKLWLRQTMLSLGVMLVTLSVCLYFFVYVQTKSLLDTAEESASAALSAFGTHLTAIDRTDPLPHDVGETTRTTLIQYHFSVYAKLFQNEQTAYSLVSGNEYLYNISPLNPKASLPMAENAISGRLLTQYKGRPMLILAQTLEALHTPLTLYLTRDISETYAAIDSLTRAAQLAMFFCLALCALILPPVLRKTLAPLRTLNDVSGKIAGGQYNLRSGIHTDDEVGRLSASFDRMAGTVEQKILSLEDTARRRELLLGALAHEMKTPMTAIIGFSDSLLTMPLSEEERLDAAREIHEAALRSERLSQKMMRLIAVAEGPALSKRPIVTETLFNQVKRSSRPRLDDQQALLVTRADIPRLWGDGDLLVLLLCNLIDNALHASEPGCRITLSAFSRENQDCLRVSDEGSGIPGDQIALITEPFYRVDKARSRHLGGAGLGLSLCQMIARAHGGDLTIESEPGKGTDVTVTLPGEAAHE